VKFIDEATITVQSGDGGRGCVSFRREKYIPRGGPDGGDGGKGGDVILKTTSRKRTLQHFQFKRNFKAPNGRGGEGNQRAGKKGQELVIEIPAGTLVINAETGELIKDFVDPDESFVVAKGGRGGQGNKKFATSTHRTPRFAQPGEPGETFSLKLELKLLADVGIIGLPNAGKSSLTRSISSAHPAVGDYPFTTLAPSLGVVYSDGAEPFVIADIPGLIEGAHKGVGLGIQFLRHIERTRILIHLIDVSSIDPDNPLACYETINRELFMYNENLVKKLQVVVLNKMDKERAEELADAFQAAAKKRIKSDILRISTITGIGLAEMKSHLIRIL